MEGYKQDIEKLTQKYIREMYLCIAEVNVMSKIPHLVEKSPSAFVEVTES